MKRETAEKLLEYIDLRIREEVRSANPPKLPAGWETPDLLSKKLRGPLIGILTED